jgi:hypothetical protein
VVIIVSFELFPLLNSVGGGKAVSGYTKTDVQHTYGAGALNIEAQTNVPKTKENLGVGKGEGAGTSQYGSGAVGVENAVKAPKIKHEGLGQVDKTKEQVFEQQLEQ